jgi:hypothetical protein
MFVTVPDEERSLSVYQILVAISTLIADVIESDNDGGGVVELLHRAQLVLENAEVGVATR